MQIIDSGIVYQGTPETHTASCCFPSICRFEDGALLVSWRMGRTKDSPDGTMYYSRSTDNGATWESPVEPFTQNLGNVPGTYRLDGVAGSLCFAPVTALDAQRAVTGIMWFDRTDPERPMFNPVTEGLTTVHTLLSESTDQGHTWSAPRLLDAGIYHGHASICAPIIKLPDGCLACQVETNKEYHDPSPWLQRACLLISADGGQTWPELVTVAHDPTGRIRNWDQRHAVAPDGRGTVGIWAFDAVERKELNFRVSESLDNDRTWAEPWDPGIPYQQVYPVYLPDGRLVMLAIDRYQTRTIRALLSEDYGRTFSPDELVVHQQPGGQVEGGEHDHQIADQQLWTFGRIEAVAGQDNDVWVVHYAGDEHATHIRWVRLRV